MHHELHITAKNLNSECIKTCRQGVWKLTSHIFRINSLIRIEVTLILFTDIATVWKLALCSVICRNLLHIPLQ
jgi:hypothetical protein